MRRAAIALAATVALLGAAPAARAQSRAELDAAIEALGSDSRADVEGGLQTLGLAGSPRAVAPIAARIRRGLPPDLLEVAVDTLTILGRAEAGPVLFELTRHRRSAIRLKAVRGIVATEPRGADRVLIEALSDTDAAVRGAAAEGLGTLGATRAIDPLFHALERRVPEAPMAIARLAGPADVDRFLEHLTRLPFDQITPALSEMLHRDDLAARAKLAIIHRLTELATPEVRAFLEDFVSALDADDDSQVRRAAEDAIPRIGQ
ncbi:MAG TPA: HEAT repeat domain-containing protein [Sandaracinaceae bacterium LLY-WYZ-13_1]|nr:HEAT repeat domain-containing protein [Sandaracinaceae bacterium LLY-WYZ-13_1]